MGGSAWGGVGSPNGISISKAKALRACSADALSEDYYGIEAAYHIAIACKLAVGGDRWLELRDAIIHEGPSDRIWGFSTCYLRFKFKAYMLKAKSRQV